MTPDKWIWMPHPAHFIAGFGCRFRLATYVGNGFLVSTVGEYISPLAKESEEDFLPIGCDRLYETMVFKAERAVDSACCPWIQKDSTELDFEGYNKPNEAMNGHMKMCLKWSKKKK